MNHDRLLLRPAKLVERVLGSINSRLQHHPRCIAQPSCMVPSATRHRITCTGEPGSAKATGGVVGRLTGMMKRIALLGVGNPFVYGWPWFMVDDGILGNLLIKGAIVNWVIVVKDII